jgi:hypothetical protein
MKPGTAFPTLMLHFHLTSEREATWLAAGQELHWIKWLARHSPGSPKTLSFCYAIGPRRIALIQATRRSNFARGMHLGLALCDNSSAGSPVRRADSYFGFPFGIVGFSGRLQFYGMCKAC